MALGFLKNIFGKKVPDVGAVDIGSNTIKICQITGTANNAVLFRFATCPTPPMTIKDGSIVGSQALGDVLKSALQANNIPCKKIMTSVGGQQVVIRPIPMTKMTEKELNQAIKFEAERYLPYSVADAQISGKVISDDAGDGKNMEVLLIAVPNEILNNAKEVVKMAEVEPGAIDLEPLAFYRALRSCTDPGDIEKTLALVNMGASSTSINIFKAGVLRHNRTVPVAGNTFTKAIGQALNLSFEDAEQIKQEKATIRVDNESAPLPPTTMRIFTVIGPVLQELVNEVQRSFDYYRSRYKGETVDVVVLSGGTAKLKNIDAFLSKELKVRCEIANPFKRISLAKVPGLSAEELLELAPIAMGVVGLALREVS
jgi:type IV pilus assembly protein PilM